MTKPSIKEFTIVVADNAGGEDCGAPEGTVGVVTNTPQPVPKV